MEEKVVAFEDYQNQVEREQKKGRYFYSREKLKEKTFTEEKENVQQSEIRSKKKRKCPRIIID